MNRLIRKWELIGIAVIASLGSVMHFAFEWSGELQAVGAFAAVNESVFEHLKLTYWPALFYAAIEYRPLKQVANNFIIGKTVGLYVMPATIIGLFYLYTAFTHHNLAADIGIFIGAVALGQLVSYRILTRGRFSAKIHRAAVGGLISLGAIYAVFTFYPLYLSLFMDSVTGGYGIQ